MHRSWINVAFFILLSACGGGSDNNLSPPSGSNPAPGGMPVGGPPANRPPVLDLLVSDTDLFEDRGFSIDWFDTSDPDGDGFDVQITQIAGPHASTHLQRTYETFYTAPFVDGGGSQDLVFEVTATDSKGAVTTEQVIFTVFDDVGPGIGIAKTPSGARLVTGTTGNIFVSQDRAYDARLILPGQNGGQTIMRINPSSSTSFPNQLRHIGDLASGSVDFVDWDALDIFASGEYRFIILSEDRNSLDWYRTQEEPSSRGTVSTAYLADNIDVENPCFFASSTISLDQIYWIGQRQRGLSMVRLTMPPEQDGSASSFDHEILDTIGEGRSFCHIFHTQLPRSRYPSGDPNLGPFYPLIAVDYDKTELVIYGYADGQDGYQQLEVLPLELQGLQNQKVVDVISVGWPSVVPRYMMVLLSDGIDGGTHSLVQVNVLSDSDNSTEIEQQTFSWIGGIPIKLVHGPFVGIRPGNQLAMDYVAVSATSDQSMVFQDLEDRPISQPPRFARRGIPFPPGASSAVGVYSVDQNLGEGVLATFPEDQSIRFIPIAQ